MAVAEALQLQGAPYVYGGESPSEGFDCSGLVYYVYYRQGLRLPRDTQSLARQLPAVAPEQRLPGDLLFFNTERPYSHVGIYIGGEQFVHAPSARTGRVMVSDLRQPIGASASSACAARLTAKPCPLTASTPAAASTKPGSIRLGKLS